MRNARVVSGLILLSFLTGPLANLILGLHPLAAMEAAPKGIGVGLAAGVNTVVVKG